MLRSEHPPPKTAGDKRTRAVSATMLFLVGDGPAPARRESRMQRHRILVGQSVDRHVRSRMIMGHGGACCVCIHKYSSSETVTPLRLSTPNYILVGASERDLPRAVPCA